MPTTGGYVFPGAGRLFSMTIYNGSADKVYVQLRDTAAATPGSKAAFMTLPLLADATGGLDWGATGRPMAVGIQIFLSSTPVAYTGVTIGEDEVLLDVEYRH